MTNKTKWLFFERGVYTCIYSEKDLQTGVCLKISLTPSQLIMFDEGLTNEQ